MACNKGGRRETAPDRWRLRLRRSRKKRPMTGTSTLSFSRGPECVSAYPPQGGECIWSDMDMCTYEYSACSVLETFFLRRPVFATCQTRAHSVLTEQDLLFINAKKCQWRLERSQHFSSCTVLTSAGTCIYKYWLGMVGAEKGRRSGFATACASHPPHH